MRILPQTVLFLVALAAPLVADHGPLRLQLKWVHQFQFAGYYAAEAKGYYRDAGLDVRILEGGPGIDPLRQIAEGTAEFAIADSGILLARAEGLPVVALAAVFQHSPYVLMSLQSSGIRVPSDLVGKRVMLADDQGAAQFRAMLVDEGIDPAKVRVIPHSWEPLDLIKGRVDAVTAYAMMEPLRLRSQGIETSLLKAVDYGIDFYGDTLCAHEDHLRSHADEVDAFVEASMRGWSYAMEHPGEIADLILQKPGVRERGDTRELILEQAAAMREYISPDLVAIGHMNPGRWRHIGSIFAAQGMIPRDFDATSVIAKEPEEIRRTINRDVLTVIAIALMATLAGIAWLLLLRRQVARETRHLREAEERQRRSAESQAAILNALPAEVALLDKNGLILAVNETWMEFLGEVSSSLPVGSVSSPAGSNYIEVCERTTGRERETAQQVATGIRQVIDGSMDRFGLEYPCFGPNRKRWFRVFVTRVGASADAGAVVTHIDITDRKLAELRALRIAGLHAFTSEVNLAIVRSGDEQKLFERLCEIAVEKGGCVLAWVGLADKGTEHLEPVAIRGNDNGYVRTTRISMDPDDPRAQGPAGRAFHSGQVTTCKDFANDPAMLPWRDEALKRGIRASGCFPLRREDKVVGVLSLYSGEPGHFGEDEISLLTALSENISFALTSYAQDRKAAAIQQSLRDSEERFRLIAETIDGVFWMTDASKERMLYVSPAYQRIWGRTCADLYANPASWVDAIHQDDRERVLEAAMTRQESGDYLEQYRIVRPDRSIRWIRDRAYPVKDSDGTLKQIIGLAEDITQQRHLEDQYLRAQRLESIGTLAGGIAHDLNNVLAPITLAVEILRELVQGDQARMLLDTLERSARRGSGLIRQVLSFARGMGGEKAVINLQHPLHEIERILRETFPKNITLDFRRTGEPWLVDCDPTQVHQVVMNLVVNARDAMPDGGRLSVLLENADIDENYAAMNPGTRPGRYVVITVADTGTGIPPEVQSRIFEPFFTTKEVGHGTGLGLSTTLSIIKGHGGFINLVSEPNKGATFKVYLPATLSSGTGEAEEFIQERLPRGKGETVLVVDDEEPIRDVVQKTLTRHGYQVLIASNGAEAVALYARQPNGIDLVLTDMAMPIMDGPALIAALKAINPGVRIIASSGMASNGGVAKSISAGVTHFVPKPYTAEALLGMLRDALDRRAP